MPGIVGIISKGAPDRNRAALQLMIDAMMHESGYKSGHFANETLGVYVGWVCHEGSFADCMPIWNGPHDKVLLFHGENFAGDDLIGLLRSKGYRGSTDNASYLMPLIEGTGSHFCADLNGFFSGVLIDIARGELTLFNDPYGMQRVYCHENSMGFLFSSEAKSILKACPETREIDAGAHAQQVSMGCVLDNNTLFKRVYLLPGGSNWKFVNGACAKKEKYFNPAEWENQEVLEKEDFYNRVKATFVRILPKYLNGCRPIGMSLTGGLDTRMIMAHAQRAPGELPCYTFGSMYRDSFDVNVARRVATVCGQPHSTIKIDGKFLEAFPQLAERAVYIADGALDALDATELYVNRKAREIAPIRITGNYGSEVLRSIRAFKPRMPNEEVFSADFLEEVRNQAKAFDRAAMGHGLTFTAFKQAPWFNFNRLSLEQSQLTMRTPFMDNELVKLVYQAPYEAVTSDEMSLRLVKDGNTVLSDIVTNRGVGGSSLQLLSKARQTYLEFLRLAEFGWDYGMPHWVARVDSYLSHLHLERLFLGRHKFHHFRLWFKNELADYVKQVCLDNSTLCRPHLNRKAVERVVMDHTHGRKNYTREINKIITSELLYRLFA
jgi:asparagine synthase (glutamine-hydrolysing)